MLIIALLAQGSSKGGFIEVALRFAYKGRFNDLHFLFSKPVEFIDFLAE